MAQDRYCVVDPSWELVDPNPDIFLLFSNFNEMFFWGKLSSVYVQWSPRMTLCAGMCRYHPRNRECSIHLSKPLLSYRPRKDLVETLLHEMIHAYLFMADGDRERESHGPKFHEHMYRINRLTGANISVYHSFHDEVDHFKTHWWKCNGPCQNRSPYFGIVKRSMNRAPGPSDFWHKAHQESCGGQFIKIKEPPKKEGTKKSAKRKKDIKTSPETDENRNKKITNYFTPNTSMSSPPSTSTFTTRPPPSPSTSVSRPTPSTSTSAAPPPPSTFLSQIPSISEPPQMSATPLSDPFSGRGFVLGSIENSHSTGSSSATSHFGRETSVASASSGIKLGGVSSQQFRRGEHPLLAKLFSKQKNSNASSTGKTSLSKTESKLQSSTSGFNPPPTLTSSFPTSKTIADKKERKIEVVQLD